MITRSEINKDQEYLQQLILRLKMLLVLCVVNITFLFIYRNNLEWIEFMHMNIGDFLANLIYHSFIPLIILTAILCFVIWKCFSKMQKNAKLLKMSPMDLLEMHSKHSEPMDLNEMDFRNKIMMVGEVEDIKAEIKKDKKNLVIYFIITLITMLMAFSLKAYALQEIGLVNIGFKMMVFSANCLAILSALISVYQFVFLIVRKNRLKKMTNKV